jgi:hypothetical protein
MTEQRAELQRFQRDAEYYRGHYAELVAQHPKQWVAIFDQTVVSAAPDLDALLTDLTERGVPADQALVRHLTDKEDVLILTSR